MKKIRLLLVAAMVTGLATGCSSFQPDQTGILVKKGGSIVSVIKESLDKDYYDQTELEAMVEETVDAYNAGVGEKRVKVDKYEVKNGQVTLKMTYDSAQDYQGLNQVEFYQGDLAGIQSTEYEMDGTFFKVEKGTKTEESFDVSGLLATSNYNVIALKEELLVEVPGDIVFVSSNVDVLGKRQAKTGGEDAVQTNAQSQINDSGIPMINPEESGETTPQTQALSDLFYIIYE